MKYLLAFLLLTGCAVSTVTVQEENNENLKQIKLGMSVQEVHNIMGQSDRRPTKRYRHRAFNKKWRSVVHRIFFYKTDGTEGLTPVLFKNNGVIGVGNEHLEDFFKEVDETVLGHIFTNMGSR